MQMETTSGDIERSTQLRSEQLLSQFDDRDASCAHLAICSTRFCTKGTTGGYGGHSMACSFQSSR